MVGIDIKASINDALKRLSPVGISRMSWRNGATTTIPKKPITTDGSAARSSTMGLTHCRTLKEAASARYRAVSTPKGIDMTDDTIVTATDPIISAKIPKSGGSSVGYQRLPKIKSFTETLLKMGRPSMKRKTTIRARVIMDANATPKKVNRISFSALSLLLPPWALFSIRALNFFS